MVTRELTVWPLTRAFAKTVTALRRLTSFLPLRLSLTFTALSGDRDPCSHHDYRRPAARRSEYVFLRNSPGYFLGFLARLSVTLDVTVWPFTVVFATTCTEERFL